MPEAVLIEYRLVTDRRTDRQTETRTDTGHMYREGGGLPCYTA